MDELESTEFFEGGPTVEGDPEDDEWFKSAQMGKADEDPNNDLRGGDDDAEIE